MSIPFEVIVLLFLVLIASSILSVIFKNKEKKDKGAVFFYYGLSYRRKMIRTLWMVPLMVASIVAIYRYSGLNFYENLFISIVFLVLFFIQLIYNYFKWKKYEK